MIRMIVTDLDNTLLRRDKSISDYTLGVLRDCQARGIPVVFATARSMLAAASALRQFAPDVFIGYGGAMAIAGDRIIRRIGIPEGISAGIIRDCLAAPEIESIFATDESVALTNNREAIGEADMYHYQYSDFSGDHRRSYLKISMISTSPEVVERIAARYPGCDVLRYTGEDLYRFANREAVKWSAVQAVAAHCGVSADQIVAFGDDSNDLEMIANCGIGVAVANAIDGVKAVAGHICGSHEEDGVAHWLAEHIR